MQEETLGTSVNYHIKTEQFEGPLDLLLSLIEKRKLFINDFSLAQVADDYIAHIRRFDSFPISDVANFLVVASALVLIKSKSILPELTLSQEEEGNIDDLKLRLKLYELFRTLSLSIKEQYGKTILYERIFRQREVVIFTPDSRVTSSEMHAAIERVMNALPKEIVLPKATVKKVISLEEMVDRLTDRIKVALKIRFSEFTRYSRGANIKHEDKVEIIVGFLAMLEMVKQGVLHVTQHEDYGDIHMETHELSTPVYI